LKNKHCSPYKVSEAPPDLLFATVVEPIYIEDISLVVMEYDLYPLELDNSQV